MGLCKCEKRKVTNLFCFEHDVNVCEYCLVSDHERCIVQSYVQWLQDSDYNPICILCKNLLKEEPTIRLICYDVFHWSCIDKYASQLSANTAPAGYQCPKCKECIFPPGNLVSPVVDVLKKKLESASWARVGLGQSLLQIEDSEATSTSNNEPANLGKEQLSESTLNLSDSNNNTAVTDDESNGFVIVKEKAQNEIALEEKQQTDEKLIQLTQQQQKQQPPSTVPQQTPAQSQPITTSQQQTKSQEKPKEKPKAETNIINIANLPNKSKVSDQILKPTSQQVNINIDSSSFNKTSETSLSHNRATSSNYYSNNDEKNDSYYDPEYGMVMGDENLDRDTGDYKYQRRPLFDWLSRWMKSRQISSKLRMTRQKRILFIIIVIFISFFTLIIIFSRLGSLSTENDPALDPLNNPNIRVE